MALSRLQDDGQDVGELHEGQEELGLSRGGRTEEGAPVIQVAADTH